MSGIWALRKSLSQYGNVARALKSSPKGYSRVNGRTEGALNPLTDHCTVKRPVYSEELGLMDPDHHNSGTWTPETQ